MKEICRARQDRRFISVLLPIFLLGVFTPFYLFAEIVDKVIAVVNEEVITLSELETETAMLLRSLTKDNPEQEPVQQALEKARERALQSMIEQRLIQQKAERFNVHVSEKEIDIAYNKMRNDMSLSPIGFREKLGESGLTEESYRDRLKAQILQSRLLSLDVRSKIVVTEEMIAAHYNEHYTAKVDQGSYYLLQIGCTLEATSDAANLEAAKEKTRIKTERIRKLALTGKDFKMLAEKFSELPSAADGGDIGIFSLDEMAPAMRAAVENLKPGTISEVIETADGCQFFKLLSADEDSTVATAAFDAVKEEIRAKIYDEKLKLAYSEWVKKLKEQAYIQIL